MYEAVSSVVVWDSAGNVDAFVVTSGEALEGSIVGDYWVTSAPGHRSVTFKYRSAGPGLCRWVVLFELDECEDRALVVCSSAVVDDVTSFLTGSVPSEDSVADLEECVCTC